ncbi:MFS transporter, partial [Streptomyces sp. NPDC006992]
GLDGFRTAFLIAAGAALLGLVIAAFLPSSTAAERRAKAVPAPGRDLGPDAVPAPHAESPAGLRRP